MLIGGYGIQSRDKPSYDLRYIEAKNPWLDLKLCVRCVCKAPGPAARCGRLGGAAEDAPAESAGPGRPVHGNGIETSS